MSFQPEGEKGEKTLPAWAKRGTEPYSFNLKNQLSCHQDEQYSTPLSPLT